MNESMRASHAGRRKPKLVISSDTFSRLEALAEGALKRNPALADRLLDELGRARVVPATKLPPNIVAIGRQVTYRDEFTGRETTVVLVFPEDADIAQGRISVMTPIGVALIGLAEDASLHWDRLDGTRRVLTVLSVALQEIHGRP